MRAYLPLIIIVVFAFSPKNSSAKTSKFHSLLPTFSFTSTNPILYFLDSDGDGYGNLWLPGVADTSGLGGTYVANNLDCQDDNASNVLCLQLPEETFTLASDTFRLFFRNIVLCADSNVAKLTFVINGNSIPGSVGVFEQVGSGAINIQVLETATNALLASGATLVTATDFQAVPNDPPFALVMGHSFIQAGIEMDSLANKTPGLTFLGTNNSGGPNHEGYGGWGWGQINSSGSPFFHNGQLNIPHYLNNSALNGQIPDYWLIQLDVNDFFFSPLQDFDDIDQLISTVWTAQAEPILAAVHSAIPNAKIGFGITCSPGVNQLIWRRIQHRIAMQAQSIFAGRDDDGIFLMPLYLELDPTNHISTDGLHPNSAGYGKLARMAAGFLAHHEASRPATPPSDTDGDGIPNSTDNCPDIPNTDQADVDNDGVGDVCDADADNDGIPNAMDDCPTTPNPVLMPITIFDNSGTLSDTVFCDGTNAEFAAGVVFNTGTAPFTYRWFSNAPTRIVFVDSTASFTQAAFNNPFATPKTYILSVEVTDANGCKALKDINVVLSPRLRHEITKNETSGHTPNDGIVCFGNTVNLVAASTSNATFSYSWSNGGTTQTVNVTPPFTNSNTNYSVTVTDAYGCSLIRNTGVTGISEIQIESTSVRGCTAMDGDTVTYLTIGGTPFPAGYQATLNGTLYGFASNPFVVPTFLGGGNPIILAMADQNGCIGADTLILPTTPAYLAASAEVQHEGCTDLGFIDLSVSGGTPNYVYTWSTSANSEDVVDLEAGTYSCTIQDGAGCTLVFEEMIEFQPDIVWYLDADDDGYGSELDSIFSCTQPTGYVAISGDCNDADDTIHPNAVDLPCNGIDDDCVGGDNQFVVWYYDFDGDGFGNSSLTNISCDPVGFYTASVGGDCSDGHPDIYPGATEVCNGFDDDCDGQIDEGLGGFTWFYDYDEDGFGGQQFSGCALPSYSYSLLGGDCNDGNPEVYPGATELCNGVDDNCDGIIPSTESDPDQDGVLSCADNCPTVFNPNQQDTDNDGIGDACSGSCPTNIIVNPQFNQGLAGWTTLNAGTVSSLFTSAPKSMRILPLGTASQTFPAFSGAQYVLSVQGRHTTPTNPYAQIFLRFRNSSGTLLQSSTILLSGRKNTWALRTISAIAPSGTASVWVEVKNRNTAGNIFFDDWCLEIVPITTLEMASQNQVLLEDDPYSFDFEGNMADLNQIYPFERDELNTTHDLLIYPNPADEYIQVLLPGHFSMECVLSVHDSQGRTFQTMNISEKSHLANIETLPPGVYFLTVKDLTTGQTSKQRFVVARR